jgi:hypothetical protein
MRAGEQLRFRGPAGAPFVVTVGAAFDERTITGYIESGEWTPLDDEQAAPGTPDRTPKRPAQAASKGDWVTYAVDQHGLDREEAESMTKQQLIDATADKETPTGEDDGHGG